MPQQIKQPSMRRLIMRLLKLVRMIHFSIKTPQWITIYSAKAKRKKARTKHHNWLHTQLVQRSSCFFALVMFQKCSVFTSQSQTEDREGRKHLLPVEEVHSQKTNSDFTQRQLRVVLHRNSGRQQQGGVCWSGSIYFGSLWLPPACSL